MKEIIRSLSSLGNILDKKTFNQLSTLVEAILSMTRRVTMLGMSRCSEAGGSYRTIQRFFGLPDIPWERMNWLVFMVNVSYALITNSKGKISQSVHDLKVWFLARKQV